MAPKKAKAEMTQAYLHTLFDYNADAGVLTWIAVRPRVTRGKEAGRVSAEGRKTVVVDAKHYKYHRLVWLYVYGSWPIGVVDHMNGDPLDNRIVNLRDVPTRINNQNHVRAPSHNKTSGLIGAHWHKVMKKFCSQIRVKRKLYTIGYFDTAEEAHAAYVLRKREVHAGCTL